MDTRGNGPVAREIEPVTRANGAHTRANAPGAREAAADARATAAFTRESEPFTRESGAGPRATAAFTAANAVITGPASGNPHWPGRGVMLPRTTRRRAPVAAGTFDGSSSIVAAPRIANATASRAWAGRPRSSVVTRAVLRLP